MRKTITLSIFTICLFLTSQIQAQFENPVKLPAASPKAKVHQQVGVTDIAISYHRPLVKGREIFGKLIPYDKVWRTGADENTIIKFSTDVTIDNKLIKAGTYGLHTIPNKNNWTIILNSETKAWGSYFYDKSKDVIRFNATPKNSDHQEAMSFSFKNIKTDGITVELNWAKTSVSFDVNMDSKHLVNENIKSQLNSLPWWGWTGLFNAAQYNLNNNVYLEDALNWVNRSVQNNRNYNNLVLKANILEKLGKTKEANGLRNQALTIGTVSELQRAAFSKFRTKDFKGGLEILKNVLKNSPNNYQSYTAMAWGHEQAKDNKSATKMYKKALKMAPKDRIDAIKKAMAKLK
jgi:tetratricopeptide (TPR) repeat protein